MGDYTAKTMGQVHDSAPVITQSGYAEDRKTVRGESIVQPTNGEMYAIEGVSGRFSNPTPGTGITSQASITAYGTGTTDVLHIFNGESAKYLIVDYVKMYIGTVPGGSGTQKYEVRLDTQTGYTSGGTALTLKRSNLDVTSPFGNVTAFAGALTTVAGSANMEKSFSGELRNGVGLAGDTFLLTFGLEKMTSLGGFLLPATTVGMQRTIPHNECIVKPGGSFRMSHYGASLSTAAVIEWEIGVRLRARQVQ